MSQPRLSFIDWMKAVGLLLIVYGHITAASDRLFPPIYPKQLGVALFLFCTGHSLAREQRPSRIVIFNRVFEVLLFGVACAVLVSVINYLRIGDPNESNYLPFLFGLNVFFDAFPANPTTWYIGTYIQFLLIWALALRGVRIRSWMLGLSVISEIVARAALMQAAGLYIAYMAIPNWMTIFLLGLRQGQKAERSPGTNPLLLSIGPIPAAAGLVLLTASWSILVGPRVGTHSFPFMQLSVGPRPTQFLITSLSISFLYVWYTVCLYAILSRLPEWGVARFIARNTVIVFVAHMPLFHALQGPVARWTVNSGLRAAYLLLACFLALAAFSEVIRRVVRPESMRDAFRVLLFHDAPWDGHSSVDESGQLRGIGDRRSQDDGLGRTAP